MILKCLYIDTPPPAFLTLEPGYEAGFLSAAELDQYVDRAEYGLTEWFVAREFAMGHECFAARQGTVLATYGWYSTTPTYLSDDLSVRFGGRVPGPGFILATPGCRAFGCGLARTLGGTAPLSAPVAARAIVPSDVSA